MSAAVPTVSIIVPVMNEADTIAPLVERILAVSAANAAIFVLRELRFVDDENGRSGGLKQFLDEKSYRPGLGAMRREKNEGK